MGCNCGGSTRRHVQPAERDSVKPKPQTRERRKGGPGQEGYYWTGPKRTPKPDSAA